MKEWVSSWGNKKYVAMIIAALYFSFYIIVHRNLIYHYLPILKNSSDAPFSFLVMLKLSFAGFSLGLLFYKGLRKCFPFSSRFLRDVLSIIVLAMTLINYFEITNEMIMYVALAIISVLPSCFFGLVFADIIDGLKTENNKIMFYLLIGSALGVAIFQFIFAYMPFIFVYTAIFFVLQLLPVGKVRWGKKLLVIVFVSSLLLHLSGKENYGQFYGVTTWDKFRGGQHVLTKFTPDGIIDIYYMPTEDIFYMLSDKNGISMIGVKDRMDKVYSLAKVPHQIRTYDKSLVIAAGGGQSVVADLYMGVKEVTAVEISQNKVDLMKNEFAAYSNYLYRDPRVTVINDSGRHFMRKNKEKFDLITVAKPWAKLIVNTMAYDPTHELFTEEALDSYLDALNDQGVIYWNLKSRSHLTGLKKRFGSLKKNMVIFLDKNKTSLNVLITKDLDLMGFYRSNQNIFQFIYYPGMELTKENSELLDQLIFNKNENVKNIDKHFWGDFNGRQLQTNFTGVLMLLGLIYFLSQFFFKNKRVFLYFTLGVGYEIVLALFIIWLSFITVNMVKLTPIAFLTFFIFGSLGYWQAGKMKKGGVASICILLVAMMCYIGGNNFFLGQEPDHLWVIVSAAALFAIAGFLITIPFGYIIRSEKNMAKALAIDYTGSLVSLPILLLIPNIDYLLAFSIVTYLIVGLLIGFGKIKDL